MKQTVLGEPRLLVEKQMRQAVIHAVGVFVLTALLSVLILLLRTERRHDLCLIADVTVSLLGCWYLVWFAFTKILPTKRLLRLASMPDAEYFGTVEQISQQTERYFGFDCVPVTVSGRRMFVINNGNIALRIGDEVTVLVSQGVVKEVRL